jgi:AcrR family transcriptional regulator
MAHVQTPRDAWIGAAFGALAEGGPDAVRIEPLAARLGVSKGGFYWHFKDRPALLAEMLDAWEKAVVEDIIVQVEDEPDGARAKLLRLFELASSYDGIRIELALRDWSRRDDDVAARVRRVDNRRMDYLRSLFAELCADEDDVEARCMLAFSLFIGSHFVAAEHGDRTRPEVLRIAFLRLLSDPWD